MKALARVKPETITHDSPATARARELKRLIDSATAELAAVKAELVAHATGLRLPGESTVHYADGARVTWSRRYRDVPESELPTLQAEGIADAFTPTIRAKLKSGADTASLLEGMLAAGLDPHVWFELASVLVFRGDDQDPRYAEAMAQLQVAPSVVL